MSRTNLGSVTEDDIDLPKGLPWDISVSGLDLSKASQKLFFSDSISQSGEFEIDVVFTPKDISGGDKLKVSKEGKDGFYGVVTKPGSSSQGNSSISGGGAAEILRDVPVNGEYIGSDTQSIVNDVFSQVGSSSIEVGPVNEELTSTSGSVDARADDEGALSFLNRVIQSHGGEWYTSYDSSNDVFQFNVTNKLESGSTVETFTQNNTVRIDDEPVVNEEYDGVIVKGYGDGEDQIVGEYPARDQWPSEPKILKYTDKTILSEKEADDTAESVYNKHSSWRSIYVYPSDTNKLLELGDKVKVEESRTGINDTFRVVSRTLNLDYKEGKNIEYVLSEKPLGIIDEAEDVKEQTDSETDYMQGSRNVWGEKESDNCSDVEPLEMDIYVPEDIEDKTGSNKTSSIRLNYAAKPYRQSGSAVDSGTLEPNNINLQKRLDSASGNFDKRVDNTSPNSSGAVSGVPSNSVAIEESNIQDHSHDLNGGTSNTGFIGLDNVTDQFESINIDGGNSISREVDIADHTIKSEPVYISYDFSDNDGIIGRNFGIKFEIDYNEISGYKTEVNETFQTGFGGQTKKTYPLEGIAIGRTIDRVRMSVYSFNNNPNTDLSIVYSVDSGNDHDHEIPDQTGGVSTGAKAEAVAFTKSGTGDTRFRSEEVSASSSQYVDSVTDNTLDTVDNVNSTDKDTVESVGTQEKFFVENVDQELLVDNQSVANNVQVIIDGNDVTQDLYGSSDSQTSKDQNLDITQYLNSPGWHTVKLKPDQITFLKSRVFLDHYKDSA